MRFIFNNMMWRLFAATILLSSAANSFAADTPISVLTIDGVIGPAAADYIVRGLARAAASDAQLVVLQMDTPGGLDSSMRQIIKAILASSVPVASYVAPSGARAASAGTYILYASHIAAMANGTNLGAATPVQIGGGDSPEPVVPRDSPRKRDAPPTQSQKPERTSESAMTRKVVNDAAAYIRGLAQLRGRNAEWAERAVREAVSLSSVEALKLHVIDYVAVDINDLARQLDGKSVRTLGVDKTLATKDAPTLRYDADWRTNFLGVITNPSIALILMMIGVYGLLFEFAQPGMVAPGVIGALCLLIGLFALQMLPINYAGLGLIGLGIGFMVAEAFLPSFGALGIGGVIALVIGTVILLDTDTPGYGIPLSLVIAIAVLSLAFVAGVSALALRARRRAVVSGTETLIGASGVVVDASGTETWARIHGELWQVRGASRLASAQRVKVTGMDGLTLDVVPDSDT